MASNSLSGLIPRGSLGLKLLLVCCLVVAMGLPLLLVGIQVSERQSRAFSVTEEIGVRAGGAQIVGGPVLLVPTTRPITATDDQGRQTTRIERGTHVIFAETGSADAEVLVERPLRRQGIYRAAVYSATTRFAAAFDPTAALADADPDITFDWSQARIAMYVRDSRAIREAVRLRFPDGQTRDLEPLVAGAVFTGAASYPTDVSGRPIAPVDPGGLQAMAALATPVLRGPAPFTVETDVVLTGARAFSLAAFAMETTASIRGDWRATKADGYFQTSEPMQLSDDGFAVSWRVPFIARGLPKAGDSAGLDPSVTATRSMNVEFTAVADIYRGVMRAVQYGIMFIGIVFLAAFVFEAVGGRRAHPAQYVLVGLAQCVFYLLLLSITELAGFTAAFAIAAGATVLLLSLYAASAFKSVGVGLRALLGLTGLYGAMYVLMTMEDYALLAGSIVAFLVVAGAMIATRGVDWYGRARSSD